MNKTLEAALKHRRTMFENRIELFSNEDDEHQREVFRDAIAFGEHMSDRQLTAWCAMIVDIAIDTIPPKAEYDIRAEAAVTVLRLVRKYGDGR